MRSPCAALSPCEGEHRGVSGFGATKVGESSRSSKERGAGSERKSGRLIGPASELCDRALWPGSVIGYCSPLVFSCPALLLSSLVAEQLAMSIPTQIIDTAMCDIWPSLGSFAWLDNYVLFECSLGPTIHQGMKALINLIKFKNKQCAIEKLSLIHI